MDSTVTESIEKKEEKPAAKVPTYLLPPKNVCNVYHAGSVTLYKWLILLSVAGIIAAVGVAMTDFVYTIGMTIVGLMGLGCAVSCVAFALLLQAAKNAEFIEAIDESEADTLTLDAIMEITNYKSRENLDWFVEDAIRGGYLSGWKGVVQGCNLVGIERIQKSLDNSENKN